MRIFSCPILPPPYRPCFSSLSSNCWRTRNTFLNGKSQRRRRIERPASRRPFLSIGLLPHQVHVVSPAMEWRGGTSSMVAGEAWRGIDAEGAGVSTHAARSRIRLRPIRPGHSVPHSHPSSSNFSRFQSIQVSYESSFPVPNRLKVIPGLS